MLTADHGATYGEHFYGKTTVDAGNSNWYYAPANLGVWDAGTAGVLDKATYSNPSPDIAALNADGNVQFSYQSTAIEAWLLDHSPAANKAKADADAGSARRDRDVLEERGGRPPSGSRAPTR